MGDHFKIFIVEDDLFYAKAMQQKLAQNPLFEIEVFTRGRDVLANMHKKPSLITLDYSLPDMEGNEVLQGIQSASPDVQVVVVSGQEDVSTALELLKQGAYDYIVKDKDALNRLEKVVNNIEEHHHLKKEVDELRDLVKSQYSFEAVVGNSTSIRKVFAMIERASKANIAVSLTSEPGSGSELVAKTIHYNSARKDAPVVVFDVSSLPNDILERELYGYEKEAFPGAYARKIGKLEEANGGTLYIKGLAEVSPYVQSVLLEVLYNSKYITRLGGAERIELDLRIICSFPKEINEKVKEGVFREDLYYKLLGLPIDIPPLRERGSDVVILAKHFLDNFTRQNDMESVTLSSAAQEKLLNYPFPGNIRELKAVIELAAVMATDNVISPENITFNSSNSLSDFLFEEKTLKDYTRGIIRHFLDKYDNNVLLVADKLDVGKSTIYRMIKNKEI